MDFTNWFFIFISLVLYGAAGWIFIQFLGVVWKQWLPKFTSGKLTIQEIFSIAVGVFILGAILVYAPYGIAVGIQKGWNNFQPVMMDIAEGIILDVQGMLEGSGGINVTTTNTTTTVQDGINPPVLSGPTGGVNPLTGNTIGDPNVDPLTGQLYNDPNVGGGGGGMVPTPIMPNMQQPPVQPTPTLAPTATPFNINSWTPEQPVPTPQP